MAPLLQALETRFKEKLEDGTLVYQGSVDPEWTIAAIPHGGYALGLILDAALRAQSTTSHKDVCHCTAHYLRSALPEAFEVHIKTVKTGRGFSNLTADLIQQGGQSLRISTHLIFTSLPDRPPEPQLPTPSNLTVTRPSDVARQIPIEQHSSQATATELVDKFQFKSKVQWSEQWGQVKRRNKERRADGRGGVEWAAWMQLKDERDAITSSTLAFFADMFRNLPELLPKDQKAGPSWFPTMVIILDFKVKVTSEWYKNRTVGLWAEGKFMQDGRHDNTVEVWTAPTEFGEAGAGEMDKDWRKEQHCLCVSTQMALCLPLEVNQKRAVKTSKL